MNILFRADSSSAIGTGHIMRDLVLANQYPDATIVFAARDLPGNINYKIYESEYKIEILKSNNIEELNALIKKYDIDMIVIDHYEIDYDFEKKLKFKNPALKILSFDDTYENHYCDILLNHNISADAKKYKDKVPKYCELRCGSKYTLLREEFIREKNKQKKQFDTSSDMVYPGENSKVKIYVAIGGSDHSNINIDILQTIKKVKKDSKKAIKVNIVTTTANQNLKKLKKFCENNKWVVLHINSNKIAELMIKSHLTIVTPSVTVNEVYFMGLPMIVIKTAQNQEDMYQFLKNKNYQVLDNMDKDSLEKSILKMIATFENKL